MLRASSSTFLCWVSRRPGAVGGGDLRSSLCLGYGYPKACDLLHQHRVRVAGGDGVVHPAGADDEAASLSHLQGTALVAAYPNCVRRVCRLGGGGQQGRGHGSGQEQGQDFSVFHAQFLRFVVMVGLPQTERYHIAEGKSNTIRRQFLAVLSRHGTAAVWLFLCSCLLAIPLRCIVKTVEKRKKRRSAIRSRIGKR